MKSIFRVMILLLVWFVPASSVAQDYIPDVIEFQGANSLVFPPNEMLTIVGGGTIEFWVSPDWLENPGYDPVILSNTGEKGPSYAVAIQADKKGIIFYSGEKALRAPFDFSDGKMHFVAITDLGDRVTILVDSALIADVEMSFSQLPSSVFSIGSFNGNDFSFIGAVAALRIWDAALDPDDLIIFAMKDIHDETDPHPDLDTLVGLSDFRNYGFRLSDHESE